MLTPFEWNRDKSRQVIQYIPLTSPGMVLHWETELG